MAGLEIAGQSYRSSKQVTVRSTARGKLASDLQTCKSVEDQMQVLQRLLAPKIPGGLQSLLLGIKYMAEDHSLRVTGGEIKDILISMGCKISQQDSIALFRALAGNSDAVVPKKAAEVLGLPFTSANSRDSKGNPVGGYNIDNIKKLCGIHATRHLEKAVVRSETRQHKHLMVVPAAKLLELLKDKMMEHLPAGAGILDAVRLFHKGHGTRVSFSDFKTTILVKFNLAVPEKRLRSLFSKFDDDGGGDISIEEFVSHVWEPKGNNSPVKIRANQQKLHQQKIMAKAQRTYEKSSLGHLGVDEAARLISEKLRQHIHAGGNELLQAFREFHHGHGMEIDRGEFIETLKELGIKLHPLSEYDELFEHFDKTKTGTISFQEFCNEVMRVNDAGKAAGESNRESAVDMRRRKALERSKQNKALLGNVDLVPILRERLMNHVDTSNLNKAFHKFKKMGDGHNSEGLTLEDFFSAVKRLGMRVERKQCDELFYKIAGSKSSIIDLPALRKNLFPTIIQKGGMNAIGNHTKRDSHHNKLAPIVGQKTNNKLQRIRDDTDMRELIRSKLMERMSGGANELLKAFRSFHSGHGLEITPSEFNGVVQHLLETKLPVSELTLLFGHIDTDGNGAIDYSEFVDEIMVGGKKPIMYGLLRREAQVLKAKNHRTKYSMLSPNTARLNNNKNKNEIKQTPRISPIKKKRHAASMTHHTLSSKGEKRWKQMNHAFMHEDVRRSGIISHSVFVHLLSSFKLKIDSQELIRLETRYGRDHGIHYPSFMKDMRKMMSERKKLHEQVQTPKKQFANHEEEASALLLNLITRQWRQLQFSFSQHDRGNKGELDMRTIMNIMTKADPKVPGLIPFLVPKLRRSYSIGGSNGLINYQRMIRDQLVKAGHGPPIRTARPSTTMGSSMNSTMGSSMNSTMGSNNKYRPGTSSLAMGTGRASDSLHRPLTWRLKDSLSRTAKADAIIGRIRLQIGSASERKAVLTQFEIRDSTHTNCIEKSVLRSLFARLGIKVSASDVKGLSFCFEVPKRANMFNYKDFMRVVERGF